MIYIDIRKILIFGFEFKILIKRYTSEFSNENEYGSCKA